MNFRIFLVEDDATLRTALADAFRSEHYEVVVAKDGHEARALLREQSFDLCVFDVMLPGPSGLELLRELRQRDTDTPALMLTARGTESDKVLGLELGADDYVTKPFSPRELNARVKAVLRRRAPQATDDAVEFSGLRIDPATRRVTAAGHTVAIGPTEFRLLHFFMTHTDRVYGRSQLLDQVWGDHVFVEERTVDVHIRRLRKALEPSGHDRLIETVRSAGYRFSPSA